MRRIGVLLVLVIGLSVTALSLPRLIYPVRVTFRFDYNGRPYQTSYVTAMRISLCNFELCWLRWDPGRDKTSTSLYDDSLLILRVEWPFAWETFQDGRTYPFRARWMWFNSRTLPTQIVYADGASRLSSDRVSSPHFTWMDVRATIERMSETALLRAVAADAQSDVAIRVLTSSALGGNFVTEGRLFAGIEVTPLRGDGLADIKMRDGWVRLASGCRVLARRAGSLSAVAADKGIVREWSENRGLLRSGDLWSADGGPRESEAAVMYPAGRPKPNASGWVQFYVSPVLQTIHEFEFRGRKCSGIELSLDTYAAYIEMDDGVILGLYPSFSYVVLQD